MKKKSKAVSKKTSVKVVKSAPRQVKAPVKKTQEYLILRPVTWGFLKKSFNTGDIVTHDPEKNEVSFKGETVVGSQDFAIMLAIYNRSPEKSLMKPYNKNSEEAKTIIANSLKAQSKKHKGDFTMMPVEKSDQDLIDEINIENTQIGKIDQRKKEADRKRISDQKGAKMNVLEDTSRSIDDIVGSQTKSTKMKVVKDDGALVGTGNSLGSLKKSGGSPVFVPVKKKVG